VNAFLQGSEDGHVDYGLWRRRLLRSDVHHPLRGVYCRRYRAGPTAERHSSRQGLSGKS